MLHKLTAPPRVERTNCATERHSVTEMQDAWTCTYIEIYLEFVANIQLFKLLYSVCRFFYSCHNYLWRKECYFVSILKDILYFNFAVNTVIIFLYYNGQAILFPLKHFRSSLLATLSRHCVLSSGTQRRALSCYQSEEIKILNI